MCYLFLPTTSLSLTLNFFKANTTGDSIVGFTLSLKTKATINFSIGYNKFRMF